MPKTHLKELQRLHGACTVTLDRFIDRARATCALTEECQEGPLPREQYHHLLEHRLREVDAYQTYQRARKALIDALRPEHNREW